MKKVIVLAFLIFAFPVLAFLVGCKDAAPQESATNAALPLPMPLGNNVTLIAKTPEGVCIYVYDDGNGNKGHIAVGCANPVSISSGR
jgi:hypothetical protein